MSYYGGGGSWMGGIVIFGLICAFAGWGVIEFLRWVFSFIHISFG